VVEPVRWAIVGGSDFALTAVVPALGQAAGATLAAVVSRRPDDVREALNDPSIIVTSQLSDLDDLGVDVVHLIVPNVLHRPLTVECLTAGYHVLVEKPMALSVGEAVVMAGAARDRGLMLAVGSNMAWSPVIMQAQAAVEAGRIGVVRHAEISVGFNTGKTRGWRQHTPTVAGGGALYDLGAHCIDGLVRILGPVRTVSALLRTTLPDHVSDDTAVLLLEHASGATSYIHTTFTHGCNQLVVTGDAGRLTSSEWLGRTFAGNLRLESSADAATFARPDENAPMEFDLATTDVCRRQAEAVSTALRGNHRPEKAEADHGQHVVAVITAAIDSSTRGNGQRTLVALTGAAPQS
jgi:predicted dehydrogenase